MKFIPLLDNIGMIYQPEPPPGTCRKHSCADCFACQWCSDDRCLSCRCGRRQALPCGREMDVTTEPDSDDQRLR